MVIQRVADLSDWAPISDTRTRRADPEWSRKAILRAAAELFSEHGFAKTTVSAIAERAGVAKGLVTHHFGSKEDVLINIIRDIIPTILRDIDSPSVDRQESAETLLRHALEQVYNNLVMNPNAETLFGLLLTEGRRHPELAQLYQREVIGRGTQILMEIVQLGQARGEFRVLDSDSIALILFGPAVTMLFRHLMFSTLAPISTAELIDTQFELLMNGLKVQGR